MKNAINGTAYAPKPPFGKDFMSSPEAKRTGVIKGKAASDGSLGYGVGDQVRHVKFGVGKVLAITDSGRDYLVTADFPGWGVKKMYASFAKLIKEE